MTTLIAYERLRTMWPPEGQHILARYDERTVTVYQAYRPSIAEAAVRDGRLGGGGFSFGRMSWIKPNFLWMMYRSGWGTKPGQEATLALTIRRSFFDRILAQAVPSGFWPDHYESHEAWKSAVASSKVRLQWDPDHTPTGAPTVRRAIQLGLRGEALEAFAAEASVEDISEFVKARRGLMKARDWTGLMLPHEQVYPVAEPSTRHRLRLATWPPTLG